MGLHILSQWGEYIYIWCSLVLSPAISRHGICFLYKWWIGLFLKYPLMGASSCLISLFLYPKAFVKELYFVVNCWSHFNPFCFHVYLLFYFYGPVDFELSFSCVSHILLLRPVDFLHQINGIPFFTVPFGSVGLLASNYKAWMRNLGVTVAGSKFEALRNDSLGRINGAC